MYLRSLFTHFTCRSGEDSSSCQDCFINWLIWDRKVISMRTNMVMQWDKEDREDKEVKQNKVDVEGRLIDTIMMTAFTMDQSKAFRRATEISQHLVQSYYNFMMLSR